jgi:CheY-like chemotaxis protein
MNILNKILISYLIFFPFEQSFGQKLLIPEEDISPLWYINAQAFLVYGLLLLIVLLIITGVHLHNLVRDKKRLENEVLIRTKDLEKKNRQIEEMARLKTRFFTDIFHEIRIPPGKDHLTNDEFVVVEKHPNGVIEYDRQIDHHVSLAEKEMENAAKKVHLLIIDDNTDLRTFIRENLSMEYSVYEADNGKSGMHIAFAKIPDIIITDVIMPDLGGVELCKRLKNDERTSHIPVVMLTAKTTIENKIEGLTSGADDYIYKPFDINELKVRISNLLVQREKLSLKFGLLKGLEQPVGTFNTIDEVFMKKINIIINENLKYFEFDVGSLQEKIGMSRVHLYRKVKALTGLSPSSIIHNYRMRRSARLIYDQAGNLTEIAMSVGFTNPSYFSKCFRDYFGVSPKDFPIQPEKQPETENTANLITS